MMRVDENDVFLGGLIVGFIVFFILWISQWTQNKIKLDECESMLPRNQHCVLVAVPEKVE